MPGVFRYHENRQIRRWRQLVPIKEHEYAAGLIAVIGHRVDVGPTVVRMRGK